MSQIIPQLAPMIIGLLLSPIPIIALIIILMTDRAQINGQAFVGGWLLGIFGVGLIVISFPGLVPNSDTPSAYAGTIRISLGLALISWAVFKAYRRYHMPSVETPRFFQKLDQITASRAFAIGLLVSAGNIKNLGFSAAAAVVITQADLSFFSRLIHLLAYSLVGSMTVLIPLGLYFSQRHKADAMLLNWKTWLISYHTYVLSAVVIFVGVMIMTGGK